MTSSTAALFSERTPPMVADTYTTRIGAILQGTGNNNNSWGSNLNTSALQVLDDAIAGTLTSAVTGGTLDLSGSPPPAAPSQARYATLVFTGTLSSDQTVIVPNLPKYWNVYNATSGAFYLFIKTTSGTSCDIPQGVSKQIRCDGSNNIIRLDSSEIGMVAFFASSSPPLGWKECDGTTLPRLKNISLFAVIGTTWGVGDGVTTFNVPNMKDTGRFPRSRTNSVAAGTYQSNQNAAHTHTGSVTSTGTSGGHSNDHSHTFSGTTSGQSATHTHTYARFDTSVGGSPYSGPASTSGVGVGDNTGAASNDHTHTYSGTTSGASASHTHSLSVSGNFTTASSGGTEARPEAAVMIACIRV